MDLGGEIVNKVVLGLSGGMDSSTLTGFYISCGYEVIGVSFEYGSKHNKYENKAAEEIAKFYNIELKKISLPFIGEQFHSNLLKTGGEIPEGHYQQENMSLTVVPGRNVIFASIMMGLAWSLQAEIIGLGVHIGDHAIYGDCRPGFVAAMNAAIIQASDGTVRIEAPFQYCDKNEILKIGYNLNPQVPYEYTRTCYKDQLFSCGRCGSCSERLEAFKKIGIKDPLTYEGDKND